MCNGKRGRIISGGHGGSRLHLCPLITPSTVSGCVGIYFDAEKSLPQGRHTNNLCHRWHHLCSLITGARAGTYSGEHPLSPANVPRCGAPLPVSEYRHNHIRNPPHLSDEDFVCLFVGLKNVARQVKNGLLCSKSGSDLRNLIFIQIKSAVVRASRRSRRSLYYLSRVAPVEP